MKTTAILDRLADLGGAKWELHFKARKMAAAGVDVIELTIGEPDVPTPQELNEAAYSSILAGRTAYSDGRGEVVLRKALAEYYTNSCGRPFLKENVLCFPGTQTALFAALMAVAEHGDEVLVGDPMYATYEGVVRATGAAVVPVPLRTEAGFRLQAADVEARLTPRSRAILLNTPHNPTGAVSTAREIEEIGALARERDLWVVSDEVYEHLIFGATPFASPLFVPSIADRAIAVSSISKSHAAPGFRSGWCVGPSSFCDALLPLSETMLFGGQPFIADMTAQAVREGSSVADGMRRRFHARAERLARRLEAETQLSVHRPEAGMFALIDVSATGMDGAAYADALLTAAGVAAMPGASFGETLRNWMRVALTVSDDRFDDCVDRIVAFERSRAPSA